MFIFNSIDSFQNLHAHMVGLLMSFYFCLEGQSWMPFLWIFTNILVTCCSIWTQHLLIPLYTEYKKGINKPLPEKVNDKKKKKDSTFYHEAFTWAVDPWLGNFSRIMVILALNGLSVTQSYETVSYHHNHTGRIIYNFYSTNFNVRLFMIVHNGIKCHSCYHFVWWCDSVI